MFKFSAQLDANDCGPACIKMIADHYGKKYSLEFLRNKCVISRNGVSLLGISQAAEAIGFKTLAVSISYKELIECAPLPCIIHWEHRHFCVLYKIKSKIYIADPSRGLVILDRHTFLKNWIDNNNNQGICLLFEPTSKFYKINANISYLERFNLITNYLFPHIKSLTQIAIALFLLSFLQLLGPLLTQLIVDTGIKNHDLNFITIILFSQIIVSFSRNLIEFVKNWILLNVSTRINVSLISDFLKKLIKLPLTFFENRTTGDIIQRIADHSRIQTFITGPTLSIAFSIISLSVYSYVVISYNVYLFYIFLFGSILYVIWFISFLKQRRRVDVDRFKQLSHNQNIIYQLIKGIQEIKLNSCEDKKRVEWEKIQGKLFNLNIRSLTINQWQQAGALFINESKNLLITFYSASEIINGNLTLGMLVSIQMMMSQLNAPIEQIIYFMQSVQDAKISIERLDEVNRHETEDYGKNNDFPIDTCKDIILENVTFKYNNSNITALSNINLIIRYGQTTAIVGTSGSGKTTLIKLLLGFYKPTEGKITLGSYDLTTINSAIWRTKCGTVMQDGYIFSDTINGNIAPHEKIPDNRKIITAAKSANIFSFINSLPLGFETVIGEDGIGLSQGQKQRILIARSIYKNPEYLFLDEATNALDTKNEKEIINNLSTLINHNYINENERKTVVVIAHRLSTIKEADNIIVLDNGFIVEQGTHERLLKKKGQYYELIRNQVQN